MQPNEPEPFEALGAPPIVPLASLGEMLSPAVGASLARHPDARPAFIGMSLLASLEGRPPPDAPPLAPATGGGDSLQGEIRALEGILSDALNGVRQGSRDSLVARLALRLIDRMDQNRQARFRRYADPSVIWDHVESGDVVLVRASWLLERAGFRPVAYGGGATENSVRAWAPREAPKPLPRRQDLERDYPEAIMPLAELKKHHRNFVLTAREAQSVASGVPHDTTALDDGAEAMPVVSVSCAWTRRTPDAAHTSTARTPPLLTSARSLVH